ncbi:hypothetical protein ABID95_006615 [Streptomyces atratus]|uniref:hypothetical protein n=1 Tax=Streptomyces atratus TaxID=1893 RepID=UPI003396AF56
MRDGFVDFDRVARVESVHCSAFVEGQPAVEHPDGLPLEGQERCRTRHAAHRRQADLGAVCGDTRPGDLAPTISGGRIVPFRGVGHPVHRADSQVYLAGGQGLGLDVDQWLGLLGEVIEAADRLGILAP